MGVSGITLDVGGAYPYIEQRILRWFGKDAATVEEKTWFLTLHSTAVLLTSKMQCVGMPEPIPFQDIYQPTRLFRKGIHNPVASFSYGSKTERSIVRGQAQTFRALGFDELLDLGDDAIIFAGPGWGKTTFLHSVFRILLRDDNVWPILITLRRPGALADLERVVQLGTKIQKRASRGRLHLLIDGYDELSTADRRLVSEAILRYQGLGIGNFYLSCREYYQVSQVMAPEVRLGGFTMQDKYRFVKTFLHAFSSPLDSVSVVNYFEEHGFSEFLSHPLLLALACIVHTSSQSVQPRSGLKLLSSALNVLSYRWDEQKQIDRETKTPIDGEDRIQILRKIAHGAKSSFVPALRAKTVAKQELALMMHDRCDPERVLHEMAQFYGILVPTDNGWDFVHRTLQDFLAAQYSVSSGEFARRVRYEWNARTAYAAALSDDSTDVLLAALKSEHGLSTVAEILDNSSRYSMALVSEAITDYFSRSNRYVVFDTGPSMISGSLSSDFVRLANTRFLHHMIEACCINRTPAKDLIVGYCLFEISKRGLRLDHVTWEELRRAFGSERFNFGLTDIGQVTLRDVCPINSKEMTVAQN